MKWQGRQTSRNVEDRRGGGGTARRAGGIGCGTIVIVLLLAFLFNADPSSILGGMEGMSGGGAISQGQQYQPREGDDLATFVSVVLKETEDTWNRLFPQYFNRRYKEPTLVLFDGRVRSACGNASSGMGPFYCPGDQKLYIDLSFYGELKNRFGAPGDFAMAYVVAHEVAHHVQHQLGITTQVHSQKNRISQKRYNDLSVRLELQADFIAGVWAHHTQKKGLLDDGDIQEALRAANAIGDDRIQLQTQGYIIPHSFTHGTSEQRMRWFKKGFTTGDLSQGDTFNTDYL